MKTVELVFQILFFAVNTFAVTAITLIVYRGVGRMEKKIDSTLRIMEYLRERTRNPYLWTLITMRDNLVNQEEYEDAAKIKELIEEEMKDMERQGCQSPEKNGGA